VVATDLPAVRWLDSPLITTASGAGPFAAAVVGALDEPAPPALAAERRAFAGRHSWTARTAEFAAALGIYTSSREVTPSWT
jgi:teichuronic acid biosynthesis glycosyltransferase TuaH